MRLCLRCGRCWSGDPARCGQCARSFRGRLCGAKPPHLSPPRTRACVTCGRTDLSDFAPSLSLEWLPRLLAGGVVLLTVRWAFQHPGVCVRVTATLARAFAAWFIGITPSRLDALLRRTMVEAVMITILLYLIPGDKGKAVRGAVFGGMRRAGRVLFHLLGVLFRLAVLLVGDRKAPKSNHR